MRLSLSQCAKALLLGSTSQGRSVDRSCRFPLAIESGEEASTGQWGYWWGYRPESRPAPSA
jgi:hypothetical protein